MDQNNPSNPLPVRPVTGMPVPADPGAAARANIASLWNNITAPGTGTGTDPLAGRAMPAGGGVNLAPAPTPAPAAPAPATPAQGMRTDLPVAVPPPSSPGTPTGNRVAAAHAVGAGFNPGALSLDAIRALSGFAHHMTPQEQAQAGLLQSFEDEKNAHIALADALSRGDAASAAQLKAKTEGYASQSMQAHRWNLRLLGGLLPNLQQVEAQGAAEQMGGGHGLTNPYEQ